MTDTGTLKQILIIDDDVQLARLTANYLLQHHYQVDCAYDGESGLAKLAEGEYQLVILDLMLPDMDGYDICKQIRKVSDITILMLTARTSDIDQVVGLEVGADDYVMKPVEPRVLLARINAIGRRMNLHQETSESLVFGKLKIEKNARRAWYDNQVVSLTSHEFELLLFLATRAGQIVPRDDLFKELVGREYDGLDRTIDLRVSNLRKKLMDDTSEPFRIKTIWGKGYLFVSDAWD